MSNAGPGTAEIYATSGGVVDTAAVTVDLIGAPVIEWIAGEDGNWGDGANTLTVNDLGLTPYSFSPDML